MKPVQHIVSVSGGKDSTATYLLCLEYSQTHGFDFRAVFADTGHEHPETLEYVRNLGRLTGGPDVEVVRADFSGQIAAKRMFIARDIRAGRSYTATPVLDAFGRPITRPVWDEDEECERRIPIMRQTGKKVRWSNKAKRRALEILYPTGIPFLDLCMWKGRFPSRRAQFCTEELKVAPIHQQIVFPALRHGPVLQWVGVRAEESAVRARYRRFERMDTGAYVWRPIHRWTVEQVFEVHRRHGLEPNPLYKLGMGRVGCMPCINCAKAELAGIARRFPSEVARVAEWEQLVTAASRRGGASFFASANDPTATPADGGFGYTIHDAVAWARTSRGGRQFDLLDGLPAPSCSSVYGLCDAEVPAHERKDAAE